ncbi:hypothetical protein Peur_034438 [Populus x canadensis]
MDFESNYLKMIKLLLDRLDLSSQYLNTDSSARQSKIIHKRYSSRFDHSLCVTLFSKEIAIGKLRPVNSLRYFNSINLQLFTLLLFFLFLIAKKYE